MADARLMVGIVSTPERAEFADKIGRFVGHLGRAHPINGIGTGFLSNLQELVSDLVYGHLPGQARPLPAHELHRITQPALAVYKLAHGGALRTMRSAIDR